ILRRPPRNNDSRTGTEFRLRPSALIRQRPRPIQPTSGTLPIANESQRNMTMSRTQLTLLESLAVVGALSLATQSALAQSFDDSGVIRISDQQQPIAA